MYCGNVGRTSQGFGGGERVVNGGGKLWRWKQGRRLSRVGVTHLLFKFFHLKKFEVYTNNVVHHELL